MRIKFIFLLGPALLLAGTLFAQAPGATTTGAPAAPVPMTEKEVITELKKQGADQLQKDLNTRGVDFDMDADTAKRLRKAKATEELIKAITNAGPKEREAAAKAAAMGAAGGGLSPEEDADFKALQNESDPVKAIPLAEGFVTKYPQSKVASFAYSYEAGAYRKLSDVAHIVEYAEKSVELKKDNIMSLEQLAYIMPSTQYIKLHQADEGKQLTLAEHYAQDALQAMENQKKPPSELDADFAKRKADYIASIHADMGMIHLDRAQLSSMGLDTDELTKAEAEYKLAISLTDHPEANDYFRLGDVYRVEGKVDDAIAAYTKASELGQGPVKDFADQQIENLKQSKAKQPTLPK